MLNLKFRVFKNSPTGSTDFCNIVPDVSGRSIPVFV